LSHPARRLAVSAAGPGTAAVGDIGFEYPALGARLIGAGIIGNGHGGGSKTATTLLRENKLGQAIGNALTGDALSMIWSRPFP
jgi:hypothetical protein